MAVAKGFRLYLGSFDECNPLPCVSCFFFFCGQSLVLRI
jgi:hypothetical protein